MPITITSKEEVEGEVEEVRGVPTGGIWLFELSVKTFEFSILAILEFPGLVSSVAPV